MSLSIRIIIEEIYPLVKFCLSFYEWVLYSHISQPKILIFDKNLSLFLEIIVKFS